MKPRRTSSRTQPEEGPKASRAEGAAGQLEQGLLCPTGTGRQRGRVPSPSARERPVVEMRPDSRTARTAGVEKNGILNPDLKDQNGEEPSL
jgi:hypothetical protein